MNKVIGQEWKLPDAIFLTHAHIGHYSGLMYLGREALGAKEQLVYAMPRMHTFLMENGPFSQLIKLKNISIHQLTADSTVNLNKRISVTPFLVPHRDEFSETVGYKIITRNKRVLFIPDIDKWHLWQKDIVYELKKVDLAFVDATFYSQNEIPHREMSEIPHPFVVESMRIFASLPVTEKNKIHFIHLNHSNPILDTQSVETDNVLRNGYHIARFGDLFSLSD